MKRYEIPEIEIVVLDSFDILTTSYTISTDDEVWEYQEQ